MQGYQLKSKTTENLARDVHSPRCQDHCALVLEECRGGLRRVARGHLVRRRHLISDELRQEHRRRLMVCRELFLHGVKKAYQNMLDEGLLPARGWLPQELMREASERLPKLQQGEGCTIS